LQKVLLFDKHTLQKVDSFPLEVKLSYPRKAIKTIGSFLKKYNLEKGVVISLNSKIKQEQETKNIDFLFPWEIYSLFK